MINGELVAQEGVGLHTHEMAGCLVVPQQVRESPLDLPVAAEQRKAGWRKAGENSAASSEPSSFAAQYFVCSAGGVIASPLRMPSASWHCASTASSDEGQAAGAARS